METPGHFFSEPEGLRLEALKRNPDEELLATFSNEEKQEIQKKQKMLSSLAYFVGKDFNIPVLLNEPGGGWYWDQKENHIKVDPKDLLEKPIDYLRFVICHEAGHRRISRIAGVIPQEVWQSPGFPFMFNALEDCRDNNFIAEAYPRFKDQMIFSYDLMDEEEKAQAEAKKSLGQMPRSMQAGFEYMKQWLREVKGQEFEVDSTLPSDVQEVVKKTLDAAQDSWWRYPSRQEADKSEQTVTDYAKLAYDIDYQQVWPEYKKLIEEDIKEQEINEALNKAIQDALQDPKEGEEKSQKKVKLPPGLKKKLEPQEAQELEDALNKAIEKYREEKEADKRVKEENEQKSQDKENTKIIDVRSLSNELKEKIKEYIENLPPEEKKKLREKAQEIIKEFEKKVSDKLSGKLVPTPDEQQEDKEVSQNTETTDDVPKPTSKKEKVDTTGIRRAAESLHRSENAYEHTRDEVLPLINKLENDLREIFTARRAHKWESGHKSGKKVDIKRRIQEKVKGIPIITSKAWERRELPNEKDYAISILVDLSGSMAMGNKILETFKGVVTLAEVLNRLSIKTEIIGFNDRLYEYEKFGESLSQAIREKMGGMLEEVNDTGDGSGYSFDEDDYGYGGDEKAAHNDDGWALSEVSERLEKEKADQKILIVLSDGQPAPSYAHRGLEWDLHTIVNQILEETNQKIIGLGIGPGTDHVTEYYPTSIADVDVHQMAETLADLILEVVENPS